MKKRDGYDNSRAITVRGLEGLLAGRARKIRLGETIYVGRSLECELHPPKTAESRSAELCKRMSRRHLKISFCNPKHIEIEDLSTNGTFLNGKRIDRIVLQNLREEPAVLDLLAGTLVIETE